LVKMDLMDRAGRRSIGENRLSDLTLITRSEALTREYYKRKADSADSNR
jgi:hypothetical protein